MGCDNGLCLSSAYYGTARYGCSFYGLIMPLSDLSVTISNQGAVALTYANQGAITFDFN